jgi:RNA 3'-terminal phosphate cyclase (ATP)
MQPAVFEQQAIDGAMGEGGGQVLRTSLSLSMCTGKPIHINNIRAGRKKPGLMRQHLTAVRAAAQIANARVSGDELGSTELMFEPSAIAAGHYRFAIGTAGSTTLVWQTILPALLQADGTSVVDLEGGTHNGMAPSLDFIEHAFVPALARMGVNVSIEVLRHGFFPMGGGHWRVVIQSWRESMPYVVTERGKAGAHHAVAKLAQLPSHVAQRELECVSKGLSWTGPALSAQHVDSHGPGNILSLRLCFANVTEVVESIGERRMSAERVANRAVRGARAYLAATHPVGTYLADQLLLPMVLGAGGKFRTGPLSEHTLTNVAVIEQLLGPDLIEICEDDDGPTVRVTPYRRSSAA